MGLFRRSRSRPEPASGVEQVSEGPSPLDSLAAERIASHDDAWTLEGATVVIDGGRLRITPSVQPPAPFGSMVMVSLFLTITGEGPRRPVFASFSGYADTPEHAVVEAACLWTCSFVPALRLGFGAAEVPQVLELQIEDLTVDGEPHRLITGDLGRVMGSEGDPPAEIDRVRRAFGGGASLTSVVVGSGLLPALRPTPTILGTFVMEGGDSRTVEVKVDGVDWPAATTAFDDVPAVGGGGMVLLRELGVLVPLHDGSTLPTRERLAATLAAVERRADSPRSPGGWRGWVVHGGRLGTPVAVDDDFPLAYRQVVALVGIGGAAPGYGLLPPRRVGTVVPLAHAGCGVTWVLRTDAEHHGEVWCDASGSDGTYAAVAPDAATWYLDWLDSVVADEPFLHWDVGCCATPSLFSQMLEANPGDSTLAGRLGPDAISLTGGGLLLEGGSQPMDPCHGCVVLATRLGVTEDAFTPGVLSR